MYIAIGVEL